jgi:hypothetical protein
MKSFEFCSTILTVVGTIREHKPTNRSFASPVAAIPPECCAFSFPILPVAILEEPSVALFDTFWEVVRDYSSTTFYEFLNVFLIAFFAIGQGLL